MKTEMEKEIFEQPCVVRKIRDTYIKNGEIVFSGIDKNFEEIKFIASGSSYNVARLAHKFFENYTSKRLSFEYASEFISNIHKTIKKDTLYCFISQSGETYDTKCALDIVNKEGGKTLAIVNNSNSTIYNLASSKINLLAGKENAVAATKSFLSGVICMWLLALYFSESKNCFEEIEEAIKAIDESLENNGVTDKIAKKLSKKKKISIIGYNYGYILAKEGALKIKETSYIDTTAYPTGEFLHGHTAVLNKNKTLIEIFTDGISDFEENTLNKIKKDFHPQIYSITDKKTNSQNSIQFKNYNSDIAKICAITVILQMLALKTAFYAGADVDKPKGLKKVVT